MDTHYQVVRGADVTSTEKASEYDQEIPQFSRCRPKANSNSHKVIAELERTSRNAEK